MNWKYVFSSVIGTSHIALNTVKQDSGECAILSIGDKDYLVCAVADGAGSAKHSDLSSNFICELFIRKTKNWLRNNSLESLTRETVLEWFIYFQKVMERAVKLLKIESIRELATTLLFSILSEDFNVFVQIGDGVIAIDSNNDFDCVFLPQNGECLNITHFATEKKSLDIFMFKTTNEPVKKIAMHTDGIEQIAFDFRAQKPFSPFFTPFFNAIEKSKNFGHLESLSKQLDLFLSSGRVNQKTDDDKTLFLAMAPKATECDNEQQ